MNTEKKSEKRPFTISSYSGYRHNRYDGFQSSWGVLIAAGGSRTADCFVSCDCDHNKNCEGDCPACLECDCDGMASLKDFFENGNEPEDFVRDVLSNLDISDDDLNEIASLTNDGESFWHRECCGSGEYDIEFIKTDDELFVDFDGRGFHPAKIA